MHVSQNPAPESFDWIAEIYDEDMGRNAASADIEFYTRACHDPRGRVLELGCGTGRVTLPLVRSGASVVGIDTSLPMLRVLRRKASADLTTEQRLRLQCCCMDMRAVAFASCFSFVLCPYSAFGYLVEEADQFRVLARVRALLACGGRFILDLFVPDPEIKALPDDHVFHDYRRRREDGSFVERTKTITKDVLPGVNITTRHYRFVDAAGIETGTLSTTDRIRYWYTDQLERLLRRADFDVLDIRGDFTDQPLTSRTRTAVFTCRPRS